MDKKYLGYIKYEGSLIQEGYLDARKSAEALIGLDEAVRFFLYQEDQYFQEINFELPVRIRKGSWEALIPSNIQEWLLTIGGIAGTAYMTSAAKKIAENDFKDKKLKDLIKDALKGMQWVAKIAIHVGSMAKRRFENLTFNDDNTIVTIINDRNETLEVPVKYLKIYSSCPDKIFSKITNVIEVERELIIGINEDEDKESFSTVKISFVNKYIFTKEQEPDELLFPELIHNNYVELDGHVTRGNENANTIGFMYNNHILTCYPSTDNIIKYKNLLFTNCIIKGYVDRLDKEGNVNEKKPRIRFVDLIINEKPNNTLTLFN